MSGISLQIASSVGAIILTLICCHPIIEFLSKGWRIRKTDVLSSLTTEAKKLYLQRFFQTDANINADTEFERIYQERYGLQHFYVPLGLLVISLLVLSFLLSQTALAHLIFGGVQVVRSRELTKLPFVVLFPNTAAAALAGAYLWVVYDLVVQNRRVDVKPAYIMLSTVRLVTAVPIGYAFAYMAAPGLSPSVAFAVSAFPINEVRIMLRKFARTKLGLTDPEEDKDRVKKLNGIDFVVSEQLQDEGITTIPQLAYCDPVQLSMKTGFSFDYVLDIVGQALAWIYVEDKLDKLRIYGLRTSVEIGNLIQDAANNNSKTQDGSRATITMVAGQLGIPKDALFNAFSEIVEDPYSRFLAEVFGR